MQESLNGFRKIQASIPKMIKGKTAYSRWCYIMYFTQKMFQCPSGYPSCFGHRFHGHILKSSQKFFWDKLGSMMNLLNSVDSCDQILNPPPKRGKIGSTYVLRQGDEFISKSFFKNGTKKLRLDNSIEGGRHTGS